MYGLVNKAIEDSSLKNSGSRPWEQILERSGVPAEVFISTETYPDEWTFQLVNSASEVSNTKSRELGISQAQHGQVTMRIR